MTTSFDALLREQASQRPDAVAVHFPRGQRIDDGWETLTYGALDAAADDYARGFAAHGVRAGDRAVLAVRPGPGFYALVFGLVRAGAVPVFVDPGMGPRAVLGCLASIHPDVVIAAPVADLVRRVVRAPFRTVRRAFVDGLALPGATSLARVRSTDAPPLPERAVDPDSDAVIVFTSGSTGPAKGVAMTHRNLVRRVQRVQEMLDLQTGSVMLETLLVYTVLEICMGMTVVVPPMQLSKPATVDPEVVLDALARFRPAVASASPVVWHRTVRTADERGLRFAGLQKLLTTAAPIPVALHQRVARVFGPDTPLYTPYGATEALPVAFVGTQEIVAETGARTLRGEGTCVGRLAPGIEVRIAAVHDGPLPSWTEARALPDGALGEIVVRGEVVSPGYRGAPGADEAARIGDEGGSWHRMGDLGWKDAQGRLWFCGRVSHRLLTARGLVPSDAVEAIFDAHPAVARSALVGVGPRGRERAVLCVELERGATWTDDTSAEVLTLADGTPYDGLVDQVLVHPGFPTDARHNSKIRREVLKRWAEASLG